MTTSLIAQEEYWLLRSVAAEAGVPAGTLIEQHVDDLDTLAEPRLAAMDEADIDVQVLFAIGHVVERLGPTGAVEVSIALNDHMAHECGPVRS